MSETLFDVAQSPLLGRYAKAIRDIKVGELILKEQPLFIFGSITGMHQCFKCFAKLIKDVYVCGRCHVATICSKSCIGEGHSRGECDTLKSSKFKPGDIVNQSQIVPAIRCLLTKNYDQTSWANLMKLESHLGLRRSTPIWMLYEKSVVEVIKEIQGSDFSSLCDADEELVQKICGILDVNTFEVRSIGTLEESESLRGLYLNAALMSHDCVGNTFLAVDEDYLLTVHAATNIKKDQPIFFNYTNSMMNSSERRTCLLQGKYFGCECKRCADPTELGTHMSSIYCQKCKTGFLVPENSLVENVHAVESLWICNNCREKATGKFVEATLMGCKNYMTMEGVDSVSKVEGILTRFADILTPNHALILDLKQNLITMYENDKLFSTTLFERKLQLCNELIQVLDAIEPEMSRLTAIAKRVLSATTVSYADYLLNSKKIDDGKYVEMIQEGESLMKEAIKILIYEPQRSPEGRLLQQCLLEMKSLRRIVLEMAPATT